MAKRSSRVNMATHATNSRNKRNLRPRSSPFPAETEINSGAHHGQIQQTRAKQGRPTPRTLKELNNSLSPIEIVDRMSKQFRMIDEDISFKNSPRYSRKDVMNVTRSPATPAIDSKDCYEFTPDADDCVLRLDWSPVKSEKVPETSKSNSKRKRRVTGSRSTKKENRSASSNAKDSSTKRKIDAGAKNESGSSLGNGSTKKRKMDNVLKNEGRKPSRKNVVAGVQAVNVKKQKREEDSGVFFTPPSLYEDIQTTEIPTSTPAVPRSHQTTEIPTSTPAVPRSHQTTENKPSRPLPPHPDFSDVACETLTAPSYEYPVSPKLSPVKKCVMPHSEEIGALITSTVGDSLNYTSQGGSTEGASTETDEPYKALDISKTYSRYSGLGYFDRPLSSKKKRSNKKAKRQSVSRYDVMAQQLNDEFDQLEDFQLSVD